MSHERLDLGGLSIPKYLFHFPNESRDYYINVITPSVSGRYILKITAVQEGKFWFDIISSGNVLEIPVEIC